MRATILAWVALLSVTGAISLHAQGVDRFSRRARGSMAAGDGVVAREPDFG